MVKKLKFSRIDLADRVGALMLVTYLDDNGDMYQWAPKWKDVEEIFLKQINVERYNKPESEFLNRFAKTAQSVVEGAQRIESARKLSGFFIKYEEEKLVFNMGSHQFEYLTPGFDVTFAFLDTWIERHCEAFVMNGIVIRLRYSYQDEDNVYHVIEYPPTIDE